MEFPYTWGNVENLLNPFIIFKMALNPPITSNFEPCRVEGERFILKRNEIEFEVKVPQMGTFKGKGVLVLSTA